MEKKTLARLVLAIAVAAGAAACRRGKTKSEEAHLPQVLAPLPTARPFDTLSFVEASESIRIDMNGSVHVTSTSTIHTFVNAVENKYRIDVVHADGRRETHLFDGEKIWHLYPGQKVATAENPPTPGYRVWEQGKAYASGYTRREPLRGLDTLVMRAGQSTYWVYKGLVVQSEMHGQGGLVIRNTLQDLKENVKLDPGLFALPPGTRKVILTS